MYIQLGNVMQCNGLGKRGVRGTTGSEEGTVTKEAATRSVGMGAGVEKHGGLSRSALSAQGSSCREVLQD